MAERRLYDCRGSPPDACRRVQNAAYEDTSGRAAVDPPLVKVGVITL